MESTPGYTVSLLKKCKDIYGHAGLSTGWSEPTEKAPYHTLLVYFNEVGERDSSLVLELCFLPSVEEAPYRGTYLLQAFISIREDVQPECNGELLKVISDINTQLPLGAFGLFQDTGVLYFKYTSIVDRTIDEETLVKIVDQQNRLILHQHFIFIDILLDVADGIKTSQDALWQTPLL
ncbi:MAG: hypothetical protein JL50_05240 [Peptococcaceae bacterium BICA1-7]|nr:MAG: hypothetical protein JL50_05240 [Peptococcaceae bacterium BICA1-7]HBV96020.1 hypothetical protein [Desulfotomaculum sp.]